MIVVEIAGGLSLALESQGYHLLDRKADLTRRRIGPGALCGVFKARHTWAKILQRQWSRRRRRIETVDLATGQFERLYDTCYGIALEAPNTSSSDADGRMGSAISARPFGIRTAKRCSRAARWVLDLGDVPRDSYTVASAPARDDRLEDLTQAGLSLCPQPGAASQMGGHGPRTVGFDSRMTPPAMLRGDAVRMLNHTITRRRSTLRPVLRRYLTNTRSDGADIVLCLLHASSRGRW